jgi:hypothetical protein
MSPGSLLFCHNAREVFKRQVIEAGSDRETATKQRITAVAA